MSQLESAATTNRETAQQEDLSGPPAANRHRLPDERVDLTHHFSIAGHEGYLTVGFYPNGQPGEIFIRMAKEGSTIAGLMECFGHCRLGEPAAWSAAQGALRQALAYSFRAVRLDGE
jgi:ribonucleoside-diphosphate reductase alpha chain